jgi:hypothetical protein
MGFSITRSIALELVAQVASSGLGILAAKFHRTRQSSRSFSPSKLLCAHDTISSQIFRDGILAVAHRKDEDELQI